MGKDKIALVWLMSCQFCNFLDASFTLYVVSRGVEEANPVMAWAINVSPLFFIIVKLALFTVAIDFIARHRPLLLKWVAILLMSVVAWHLNFIFIL
tara:strand:+ start:181 stop:468 length:288 start_codon:yes stop_codon:yes gene_type:complete